MDSNAFNLALDRWHDFYAATAGASAALLGLLFVAVSIDLRGVSASERRLRRISARGAFANLVFALALSLSALIPGQSPRGVATWIGALGALCLVRLSGRLVEVVRRREKLVWRLRALRRLMWSGLGGVTLMVVSVQLWITGDPDWLYWLVTAMLAFLIAAADTAWGISVDDD